MEEVTVVMAEDTVLTDPSIRASSTVVVVDTALVTMVLLADILRNKGSRYLETWLQRIGTLTQLWITLAIMAMVSNTVMIQGLMFPLSKRGYHRQKFLCLHRLLVRLILALRL